MFEKEECQFRKDIKENAVLQEYYAACEPYEVLKPRDAFLWRQNQRHHSVLCAKSRSTQICGLLLPVSLYLQVWRVPLGHPEIYVGEDIPDRVQGLMKYKVLLPARLFHQSCSFLCVTNVMWMPFQDHTLTRMSFGRHMGHPRV